MLTAEIRMDSKLRKPTNEDWPVIMQQIKELQAAKDECIRRFIEEDGFYYDSILKKCVTK